MYYFMGAMLLGFTLTGIIIVFGFDAPLRVRMVSGVCQILFVFTTYEVMKRN